MRSPAASPAVAGVAPGRPHRCRQPAGSHCHPFDAAAAVLLGGTSFAGGVGGVGGTAIGVLFLGDAPERALGVGGVADYWQQIISGGILIAAVVIDWLRQNRPAFLSRRGEEPALEASVLD